MKRPVKRHEVRQPLDTSYKIVPLTKGQNALVDSADFERVSQFNWHAHWNPHTNSFYARCWQNGRMMMHKFILDYGPRKQADHINHDTLDNRRDNLRPCTAVQNAQFRKKRSDNTSGYKGVYYKRDKRLKAGGSWHALITVSKKRIELGFFHSAKEASNAYQEAAKRYFGKFFHPTA